MGKLFSDCPVEIQTWIAEQKLFFVATAPKSHHHHINVSPKGHATFTLQSARAAYYVDLTGSGNETISHLMERGNSKSITLMFVAFEGPPQIVRLFGKGRVILFGDPEFEQLVPEGDERRLPGARAIVWIDIHACATSCGYSIPFFAYEGERDTLNKFFQQKMKNDEKGKHSEGLAAYWSLKNSVSIDDLEGPGTRIGKRYPGQNFVKRIADVSTLKPPSYSVDGSMLAGVLVGILLTSFYLVVRDQSSRILAHVATG